MEVNNEVNLDAEFKRYLQIMRPYLGQLLDHDVIEICNAWIQRLSNCKGSEKNVRNKYVFSLCYQLAKGILDEPFVRYPSGDELSPLPEEFDFDESSTEVECLVINSDNNHTKMLYKNIKTPPTVTENITESESHGNDSSYSSTLLDRNNLENLSRKRSLLCHSGQECQPDDINTEINNGHLEDRANNVILKLRQIKNENVMLHKELKALKLESKNHRDNFDSQENIRKIDISTSAYIRAPESNTTLKSLKCKLQEVQNSRNSLIESISKLQDIVNNFEELKRHEIIEMQAKHKLEIIKIKTSIKEEVASASENNLETIKHQYEEVLTDIQCKHKNEIDALKINMNEIIFDKDKLLQCKDVEILQLKGIIQDYKTQSTGEKNPKITTDVNLTAENCNDLEKRLHKMEKLKNRNARLYEAKIANLQRENHLIECSLQLQLIKQRAQVVEETTNDNQTELTTALEKLEAKYKEITANVQATAVQRRIQDQIALESLIKTICDIPNEGNVNNIQTENENQQQKRNLTKQADNREYGYENSAILQNNKFGPLIVGTRSFGEDKNYYLNKENFGELFERGHIPQKDTNSTTSKQ